MVNKLGITDSPLGSLPPSRSLGFLNRCRSIIGLFYPPNHAGAAANSGALFDTHLGGRREKNIDTGTESNQTDQFSFSYIITRALPADDTARNQPGNLSKDNFYVVLTNHNHISFIFNACRGIEGKFELAGFVIDGLDSATNGAAVDVNIKNREENAHFSHVSHSFEVDNPPISR